MKLVDFSPRFTKLKKIWYRFRQWYLCQAGGWTGHIKISSFSESDTVKLEDRKEIEEHVTGLCTTKWANG